MSKKQKILNAVKYQLHEDTNMCTTEINNVIDKVSADNPDTPWWVIVLKVLAYAIGIILAGYGTASAAIVYSPMFNL